MSEFKHIPVLFNETIDALNVRPDGIYVDCTAGGGGHCAAVAERLTTGRIIAIDRTLGADCLAEMPEVYASIHDFHQFMRFIPQMQNLEHL